MRKVYLNHDGGVDDLVSLYLLLKMEDVELVDKVSGHIKVFQDPAIDFKSNMASGDDIIGDAYEYFMMKLAQESGKSKGQSYTPSEVSRTIARLIGIGNIYVNVQRPYTLHDRCT